MPRCSAPRAVSACPRARGQLDHAGERTLVADQTPWDAYHAGNTSALTPSQVAGLNAFSGAAHCAQCRVPSLRNAGLRARLFHNGSRSTIASAVSFYVAGGSFHVNQDPRIAPLNLATMEQAQLADFVANGLTDPRVAAALAPFERPGLNSEVSGTSVPYGTGSPGSGGLVPTWVVPSPAFAGAEWFALGVAQGVGGAEAFLAISEVPGGGEIIGSRTPLWLATNPFPTVLPLTLDGQDGLAGAGSTSSVTPIRDSPAVVRYTLYFQWLIADSGVFDGVAVSSGMAITDF